MKIYIDSNNNQASVRFSGTIEELSRLLEDAGFIELSKELKKDGVISIYVQDNINRKLNATK